MFVKVFSSMTEKGLEKKVNTFLEENPVNIIDIKFSVSSIYAAMILYEKNK